VASVIPDFEMFESKADLKVGRTFYSITGPRSGKPIVLVHGATVSSLSFNTLVPYLVRQGFRVLRYDLLGHGQSDCPEQTAYSPATFAIQLDQLLAALNWPKASCVLGFSMGAVVAASFAYRRPGRVEELLLVAPLLNFNELRFCGKVAASRLGPWFLRVIGMPIIRRRRVKRALAIGNDRAAVQFRELSSKSNFRDMVISLARDGAFSDHHDVYKKLARTQDRIKIIGGAEDSVVPQRHVRAVADLCGCDCTRIIAGHQHNLIHSAAGLIAMIAGGKQLGEQVPLKIHYSESALRASAVSFSPDLPMM